jgi:four helix bundle protein
MTYSHESALKEKSYAFAIRVVNMSRNLVTEEKEYILSKQVLRSGTAIGALIMELKRAESKPDFIHKLGIALKEAEETQYWISLLKDTKLIDKKMYDSMSHDTKELVAMLVSSVNTAKANLLKEKESEKKK